MNELQKKEARIKMNIQTATKQAMEKRAGMRRADWPEKLCVEPTNSSDGCKLHYTDKAPRKGWQPRAEDLIADDWVLVEEKGISDVILTRHPKKA